MKIPKDLLTSYRSLKEYGDAIKIAEENGAFGERERELFAKLVRECLRNGHASEHVVRAVQAYYAKKFAEKVEMMAPFETHNRINPSLI